MTQTGRTYRQNRRERVERNTLMVGAMLMDGMTREEIARRMGLTVAQGVRIYEEKFWNMFGKAIPPDPPK